MIASHHHEICTAAPILHEMRYGLARLPKGKRKQVLTGFFDSILDQLIDVLPYDREAALWHALERARLSRQGLTPPHIDGQIAGIAAVNGLTLITRNVNDFSNFADLKVENWFG
jgi:tRNA(fMet)-specific endonuclease VapC